MEQPNYDLNNQMILTIINYQNQNYQYTTQLNKSLTTFYDELCNYFKTDPDENSFYYQNEQLRTKNNKTKLMNIIDLQNNNSYPYFSIVQNSPQNSFEPNMRYKANKKMKRKQKSKMKINLRQNLSMSHDKKYLSNNITSVNKTSDNTINNINNTNSTINLDFSVIINEIPSINDIEIILNDFNLKNQNSSTSTLNLENNNNSGILTRINNNSIKITFQNELLLNEFINYITYIKYENPYYRNIKIVKDKSILTNRQRQLSHKNVHSNYRLAHNLYSNYNQLTKKQININDVIKAVKQNELQNGEYHGLSLKTDGEDEIIKDYYKQQMFLRNSSPYITEDEKRILEEKESKKKDFNKKQRFITSVGKYSMKPNYIPNYVGMTPSENPKTHSFRDVDKTKWITIKGFNP